MAFLYLDGIEGFLSCLGKILLELREKSGPNHSLTPWTLPHKRSEAFIVQARLQKREQENSRVVRLISRSAVIIHWPLDDQNVVDMKSRSLLLPLHLIGFSDLVGLWVIKIKKPMILCARSTPRSREQSTKRSENTWRFVYSIVKITRFLWLSNMADIFSEIQEVRKGLWAFFLDCAIRVLIGWADKLWSHDLYFCTRFSLREKIN